MTSTKTTRVLIVDDEEHILKSMARELSLIGHDCTTINGGAGAKRAIKNAREPFDAIICDLMMPEVDGLDVLRFANSQSSPAPVIILTAHGTVQAAVEAMKLGAVDFLEKPYSPGSIPAAIQLAMTRRRHSTTANGFASSHPLPDLVGSKQWLPGFMDTLRRIAAADQVTVLIDGETGTGKSAVARQIHSASPRANAPFVSVNCASMPSELVESELFGHVKGAFTGATADKKGYVAQADGGTLFLDEVGEFKHDLQSKLLTLLQERRFRPVGGAREFSADVRFVAATNKNLEVEVQQGRFREDLFFRLNVIKLTIPPLRDRVDDIPILVDYFRNHSQQPVGQRCPPFSRATLEAMKRYEWLGNIRELENLVQRLVVMHPGVDEITLEMLPKSIQEAAREPELTSAPVHVELDQSRPSMARSSALPDEGLTEAVDNYQRSLIVSALKQTNGNMAKAARLLKLKRTTLIEKCNRREIDADKYRQETT